MRAALIPAAGLSSRMGRFKPLLPVGGVPAVLRAVNAAKEAGCVPYVVTGFAREKLSSLLASAVASEVYNERYDCGMFSSVKAGLRAINGAGCFEGAVLWPADCPLVSAEMIRKVSESGRCSVASCGGKRGHPLYIPAPLFEGIIAYEGEGGLKGALLSLGVTRVEIPFDDDRVLLDMDTEEDYRRVLGAAEPEKDVLALSKGRRLVFLRHGNTVQHREKRFIGRYDVPLSEEGEQMIKSAALEIAEAGFAPGAIVTGPLKRTIRSAEICSEVFNVPVITDELFTEISLGEWDSLPIREVRERWPREYEERGRTRSVFTPPGGESYFEFRRRVREGLWRVLTSTEGDLLFVTHLGVIQCVRSILGGMTMEEAAEVRVPERGNWVEI